MVHLALFVFISGLVAGAIAATLSFLMYRTYGYRYLLSYFWANISFDFLLALSIGSLYFEQNLKEHCTPFTALAADVAYNVLAPLSHILMVFFLAKVAWGLAGRTMAKWVPTLTLILTLLFLACQTRATYDAIAGAFTCISSVPANVVHMLAILAVFAIFVCLYRWSSEQTDANRRSTLRSFATLVLILTSLMIILGLIGIANVISMSAVFLASSVLLFATILVPVLYLRWFLTKTYGRYGTLGVNSSWSEYSFGEFGITAREQEIINLVSQGRSNREIAQLLFISHQTVKDHIYHIYRKIGVRNRVQLANFFSKPPAEADSP